MGLFSFLKEAGKKIFKSNNKEVAAKPWDAIWCNCANKKAIVKAYIDKIATPTGVWFQLV